MSGHETPRVIDRQLADQYNDSRKAVIRLGAERDEALARAEAAEGVIEKVRARVVSGLDEVHCGSYYDGWCGALTEVLDLLLEVTPPDA